MNNTPLVIDASAVLTPHEKFAPGRVLAINGRIEAAGLRSDVRLPEMQGLTLVDAGGQTLVPGFIEPHIHGCAGIDVMAATKESMRTISQALVRFGTTSFLPTTVSTSPDILGSTLDRLAHLVGKEHGGAVPLGIHLEGPFLSAAKRGTHQAESLLGPNANLLSEWVQRSGKNIRLLTMAPELKGAPAVANLARSLGITVAMGHSSASMEECLMAANQGTCYAVHTFNAMPPLSHREPGMVGTVLSDDRIFAEIIADGVHVAPEVVRIFSRAKGRNRIVLATDATSATGMPDGHYALGKSHVFVTEGVCRDFEGHLAGSTLTQDRALRNLMHWTGLPLHDALLSVTSNPAEALALTDRGHLRPGARADFALLDEKFSICATYVGGNLVFKRAP